MLDDKIAFEKFKLWRKTADEKIKLDRQKWSDSLHIKAKTYGVHDSELTAFSPLGQAVVKMTCDQELWKCNVLN